MFGKLDGWKTALGAAGLILTTFAPKVAPIVQEGLPVVFDLVQGGAGLLASVGILHKLVKRATRGTP